MDCSDENLQEKVFKAVLKALNDSYVSSKDDKLHNIKFFTKLDGDKYQNLLRNSFENLLKEAIEIKLSSVQFPIFVLHLRSSLLYYDGRVDIYYGEKWGKGAERINNIKQEQEINRFLWQPDLEGCEKPLMHLLPKISMAGHKCLLFSNTESENEFLRFTKINISKSIAAINKILINCPREPNKIVEWMSNNLNSLCRSDIKKLKEILKFKTNKETIKSLINPSRVMATYRLDKLLYLPLSSAVDISKGGSIKEQNMVDGGAIFSIDTVMNDNKLKEMAAFYRVNFAFPFLSAETIWRRANEEMNEQTYLQIFYVPNSKGDIPLIKDIREARSKLDPEGPKEIIILLENVSKILDNLSKKQVRGWDAITYEILVGLRNLWDELEIEENSQIDVKNPSLMDLLGRMLNYEKGFYNTLPGYRDHFLHSFHVLAMGMWLVISNDAFAKWRSISKFWQAWFFTAMFHDIGIPIVKVPESIEDIIKEEFKLTTLEKILMPEIRWHNLLIERDFQNMLFSIHALIRAQPHSPEGKVYTSDDLFAYKGENDKLKSLNEKDLRLALSCFIASGRPMVGGKSESTKEFKYGSFNDRSYDHSVISGLLLYRHSRLDIYKKNWKNAMKAAVLPMMFHHMWEKKKIYISEKNGDHKKLKEMEIQFYPDKYFLQYLLILCDAICQAGREWEKGMTNTGIRFDNMNLSDSKNDIYLNYKKYKVVDFDAKFKKYVHEPQSIFYFKGKNIIEVVRISGRDAPTPVSYTWTFPK